MLGPFTLTVGALMALDARRPGFDLSDLQGLPSTTSGILDALEALTGRDRDDIARELLQDIASLPQLRLALSAAFFEGLRMETQKDDGGEVDVALEEIRRKQKDGALTCRRLLSFGLAAGLSLSEMKPMPPGLVMDLYLYHRQYDDEQHGIKREKRKIYD